MKSSFLQHHLLYACCATTPVLGLSSSPSLSPSLQFCLPLPLTSSSARSGSPSDFNESPPEQTTYTHLSPCFCSPILWCPDCSTCGNSPGSSQHHKEGDRWWRPSYYSEKLKRSPHSFRPLEGTKSRELQLLGIKFRASASEVCWGWGKDWVCTAC